MRVMKYWKRLSRGGRVSNYGDTKNPIRCGSEQPAFVDPGLSRGVGPDGLQRFLSSVKNLRGRMLLKALCRAAIDVVCVSRAQL